MAEAGEFVATIEILKEHWGADQIAATLAFHGLHGASDLTPEHFRAAGHTEPANGTEILKVPASTLGTVAAPTLPPVMERGPAPE